MFFVNTARAIRRRFSALDQETRGYMLAHAGGGVAGLVASLVWMRFGAPSTLLEWLVLAWLASPLALAALAARGVRMSLLQPASAANAIVLLFGLAGLSGGMSSVFLPWMALVPAEAALTRRPLALALAIAAGAAGIAGLAILDVSGALPRFALSGFWKDALMAGSMGGCLVYAGFLALNVREEHARAARRAAKSEASYRFLADNAADLILRLLPSGAIEFASDACLSLLGFAACDVVGRELPEFLYAQDRATVRHALVRAGYFGEEAIAECRVQSGSERIWIELKCRPVERAEPARALGLWKRDAKPAASGREIIAIARDVTRRHQQEEALRRAIALAEAQSRAKSRFLANMSHELRTPLNSILGFSEMISCEMFGPVGHRRYQEYAALIGESGQFLLTLINDILDVAKIEAGKYALQRESMDLPQTLERSLRLMSPQFREKGVDLAVEMAGELPAIEADARAVRQILFNLLSNALKFTPKGGTARVSLRREGDSLILEVADSGIGISAEDLKRLARPFEQAQAGYAVNPLGTGLGLALVKSLAALHGGALTIESELGRGTRASVRLPISGAASPVDPHQSLRAA